MRVIQNERTACFQDIFALPLEFLSHRLMLNEQNGEVVGKSDLELRARFRYMKLSNDRIDVGRNRHQAR